MNSLEKVEDLIARIEASADPSVRAAARDLVQGLMDFHGNAIERMVAMVDGPVLQAMARDELVRPLLLLYDLHPESTEVRVRRAVDRIPNAECIGVEGYEVRIRVGGHGRMPSREALEAAIQEAAPEVQSVVIEGLKIADFVPLGNLQAV